MGQRQPEGVAKAGPVIETETAPVTPAVPLEDLVELPRAADAEMHAAGLRSARLASVTARGCTVTLRGRPEPVAAELAPEVQRDLIELALRQGDSVLVEHTPGLPPLVVGVLQTRLPRELQLKGAKILVEAEQEIVLRVGRAALRLREDGDVELVGTRISAASRGLFRLVGRMLRLN